MLYSYKAKKLTGQEVSGQYEAHDNIDLARWLRNQDYILVDYKEKKKKGAFSLFSFVSFLFHVPIAEKMMFSRNLSVMIKAGLSLSRAMDALSRQTKTKKFQTVLKDVSAEIKKGQNLAVSFGRYPKIFPPIFTAMVKAGEKSGQLAEALDLTSSQLGRELFVRKKIKGALMYPLVIVLAMAGIGLMMMIFVVPTLVQTLEELEVELPASTRFIIFISSSFGHAGVFLVIFLAGVFFLFFWLLKTASGRKVLDIILLKMPLMGPLVKKINAARTSRTLSSLLSAGVDIVGALNVTEEVLQNHKFKEVLAKAQKEIQKGASLFSIFEQAENLFPPLVKEVVAVGEETGTLSDMFLRLAVFFEEEVSDITKNLTVLVEPLLMVVIGAVVGFFAVSMIQPIYSMVGSF
ncbi:MAG: Type II secretion system F domain protein [Parcubacteria group bacterium GW2011_GWB1_41_6]|nr:MAG: Type II secretion system F domain protein [Parcubacteria group bacterium GW2011_GWB1_41_6]